MANTYVDIEDRYQLKTDDKEVFAETIIGNAQPGAYAIFLNTKLLGQNERVKVGKASALKGRKLVITAVVLDEREETNWTSVEVIIEEDGEQKSYGPYSKEVNKELDTVTYTIKITFEDA